jgi:hypothetical protein
MTEQPTDSNVESVREKLRQRSETGIRKYGVTTDRTDLSRLDWLRHAQEEALDLAVYLERLIREEQPKRDGEHSCIFHRAINGVCMVCEAPANAKLSHDA